ncbi:MAG: hypothetical protein KGL48_11835 [Sphingomonadales bacterium]|nr:hypothetical protein [Sphingomonadales bacterium]MDE2568312.1 hypothetical protein [Sphingomonadales bacterium]
MLAILSHAVTAAISATIGFILGWSLNAGKLARVMERLSEAETRLDRQSSLNKEIARILTAILADAEKLGIAREMVANVSQRLARM